ncbi:SET domain-containing protein, partial [Coccomyxa subellipsoidea C-169]
ILECGPACSCERACPHRRSQQGLQASIELINDARKGWSAVAARLIAQGTFVCQYAGELISTAEAKQRLAFYDSQKAPCTGHALLVVREWLPSGDACLRINIDATRIGNVARFFNHSCGGGNLELVLVRCCGSPIPHVGMFARRDIHAGEELTFMYGQPSGVDSAMHSRRACYCGSDDCLGYLPAEIV